MCIKFELRELIKCLSLYIGILRFPWILKNRIGTISHNYRGMERFRDIHNVSNSSITFASHIGHKILWSSGAITDPRQTNPRYDKP